MCTPSNVSMRMDLVDVDGQVVLRVQVTDAVVSHWALGLVLLQQGLIEVLTVTSTTGATALDVRVALAELDRVAVGARVVELCLTPVTCEYVMHYFLKYHRDGFAEVDHLDVEASTAGDSMYVTFLAQTSAPPVDREEAERRLGTHRRWIE